MDPKQALRNLLQAIIDSDRDEAREHLGNLYGWVDRGGCTQAIEKALSALELLEEAEKLVETLCTLADLQGKVSQASPEEIRELADDLQAAISATRSTN